MAKAKHTASVAQRREQERVQRARRSANTRIQTGSRRSPQKSSRGTWIFIGSLVGVVVITIAAFILYANFAKPTADTKTATPSVFKSITAVKPDLLSQVNAGGIESNVSSIVKPVKNIPVLKGPNGKPEIFYMGGEFCPYCAAQRWSMIIALSRFGSFNKPLAPIISSESNIPTYTFHGLSYKSDYLDFVPVEVSDNNQPPKPFETLTPDQERLVKTYDAPPYTSADSAGSFPFMSMGNQYVVAGAYFSPTLLVGKTHAEIEQQIQDSTTDISRGVLGAANYMTAQICTLTNNQPANVCTADPIPAIQGKLPKASISNASIGVAAIDVPLVTAHVRKYGA